MPEALPRPIPQIRYSAAVLDLAMNPRYLLLHIDMVCMPLKAIRHPRLPTFPN